MMFTGIAVLVSTGAVLLYTHEVILPKVLQELTQTRIEVVAALRQRPPATRVSPIPLARNDPPSAISILPKMQGAILDYQPDNKVDTYPQGR